MWFLKSGAAILARASWFFREILFVNTCFFFPRRSTEGAKTVWGHDGGNPKHGKPETVSTGRDPIRPAMTSLNPAKSGVASYLHNQSAISLKQAHPQPGGEESVKDKEKKSRTPPSPPTAVLDTSLKSTKYGPGHEKYPSWPAAERVKPEPCSHRSKSWADQTHYPKEKPTTLARPYAKRQPASFTQQLKTVMERCEKILPENFEGGQGKGSEVFLPALDRDSKPPGNHEYTLPSPSERERSQQMTEVDLSDYADYARTYHESQMSQVESDYSSCYEDVDVSQSHLTRAELEQYTRDCEGRPVHVHQPSYAQSEGYHSYVSSTDSTTTPFLDRLRSDNEAVEAVIACNEAPEVRAGRDSSASSGSSSETLKWHGSMSDVSVSSSSCGGHHQLIAHSARVQTPQRHHSESVLYLGVQNSSWQSNVQRNNQINSQMRKLFPVSTYTVQPSEAVSPRSQPSLSVAERITKLERQHQQQPQPQQPQQQQQIAQSTRYTFLDPDKRHRVSDHSLKAIQKKALLSFYERHHSTWRSEPQLSPSLAPPPQPPPRPRNLNILSRRSSLASDHSSGFWKESGKENQDSSPEGPSLKENVRHQHSSSCGSLSTAVLGPLIMGPAISVDDWVPERPPKKAHLRSNFPSALSQRTPSPDLPPPSPPPTPPVIEDDVFDTDEPLPPPPPEAENPAWHPERLCDSPAPPVLPKKSSSNFQENNKKKSSVIERYYENRDDIQRHSSNESSLKSNNINIGLKSSENDRFYENQTDIKTCMEPESKLKSVPAFALLTQHLNNENKISRILERRKHFEQNDELTADSLPLTSLIHSSKNQPGPQVPVERKSSFSCNSYLSRNNSSVNKVLSNSNSNDVPFKCEKVSMNIRDNFSRNPSVRKESSKHSGSLAVKKAVYQNSNDKSISRYPSQSQKLSVNGKLDCSISSSIEINPPVKSFSVSNLPVQKSNSLQPDLNRSQPEALNQDRSRHPQKNLGFRAPHLPPTLPAQCPPTQHQLSQSKASYLAYRREPRDRERGLPNFEGSYKRTSSPSRISNGSLNNNNNSNSIDNLCVETEKEEPVVIKLKPISPVKRVERQEKEPGITTVTASHQLPGNMCFPAATAMSRTISDSLVGGSDHSQTLPKNYVQLSAESKRLPRTPRTQSDPSTTRDVQSTSSSSTLSLHKSVSISTTDQLLRSHSDVSTVCSGSSESGYSSSSIAVSSAAPSPSPTPIPTTSQLDPTQDAPLPSSNPVDRVASVTICEKTCAETQCDFGTGSERKVEKAQKADSEESTSAGSSVSLATNNATTNDAASQTESPSVVPSSSASPSSATPSSSEPVSPLPSVPPTPSSLRPKIQEELECEQLSRDLVSHLPISDKLHGILAPGPDVKKSTDYVSGLFKLDIVPRSRSSIAISDQTQPADQDKSFHPQIEENTLSVNSAYFTTSECKAKLLNLCSQNQVEQVNVLGNLQQKKAELVSRLDRKLNVLRDEALAVAEEGRMNDTLGECVSKRVNYLARPHEAAKFKLHVQEVGHITSLLLGLSGRLARAENVLLSLPADHTDRKTLEEKRDKLLCQLEEAKQLKENIDKRSTSVSAMLYRYLTAEEYADYDHFINMKAKLLIDSREISEKIQLGEEQLLALKETLNESPT